MIDPSLIECRPLETAVECAIGSSPSGHDVALESCPPHAWGCPVVMKRDPERVAWTCALCGAIAINDDPEVRPR
jgi:hypothetical protein